MTSRARALVETPRRTLALVCSAAFALAVAGPGVAAQSVLSTYYGDDPADYFGFIVDGLDDIDGDGVGDLFTSTWAAEVGGPGTGLIRIFSGATGVLLREQYSPAPPDSYGWAACALGDVDGDGLDDYAVGAYRDVEGGFQAGAVYVHSGATGDVLYKKLGNQAGDRFGFSVGRAGDVNADGVPDVVAGAPFSDVLAEDGGRVRVMSGTDGAPLLSLVGSTAGEQFGFMVEGAGDTDGDGHGDILVGMPHVDESRGRLELRSGADGSLRWELPGDAPGDELGRAAVGIGDVDGDGHGDVAVGLRWDDWGGHDAGSMRVLSGLDGSLLWTTRGDGGGDALGWAVAPAGDVNRDGCPDVIVGAPRYATSQTKKLTYARVCSGRDGTPIYTLWGSVPTDSFGASVTSLGDIDDDDQPDFAIGAWADGTTGSEAGAVWVYSGYTPWLDLGLTYDASSEGTALTGSGTLLPFEAVTLTLQMPPRSAPAILVVGFSMIHLPFHDGVMVPAPDLPVVGLVPDAEGTVVLGTTWPVGVPPGFGLVLQAWRPDGGASGGWAASNGLLALAP